jgi:hypothetical protein
MFSPSSLMDPNKMHVKVEENEEDDDMDIVDPKEIEVEAEVRR